MSNSSDTCETSTSLAPNSTTRAAIDYCQGVAEETYCYPPNGTRICVPNDGIPFYWPQSHYLLDKNITVTSDLGWLWNLEQENTGHTTKSFSDYEYDEVAEAIPGVEHEKIITLYIVQRSDPFFTYTYDGPTLTLIKTASSPTATETSTDFRVEDAGDERSLNTGAIIGAVIGSLIAVVLLFLCCKRTGCCCFAKKQRKGEDVVQNPPPAQVSSAWPARPARVVSRGPEMGQEALDRAENERIARVRDELGRATSGERPPNYKPEALPNYNNEQPPPYIP